ncbi:MAG: FadR family transcriptional regulator [Faecalibacterium sp.]|nr:FadR family transcriptional regulator [Faecalibacterium sp.]
MPKLQRQSLTDQIFDYVQQKILSGEWKAGEKIPSETELAAQLGVSRMSIRAALQRCNAIGFTETRVGDGTYVLDFSMQTYFRTLFDFNILESSYEQLNEFRMILQIGSMRLALLRGDDLTEDIAELARITGKMEAYLAAGNYEAFAEEDFQFHQRVCNLSHNTFIASLYEAISQSFFDAARANMNHSISHNKSSDMVIRFHRDILDGLREKDLDKCIRTEIAALQRNYQYYGKKDHANKILVL